MAVQTHEFRLVYTIIDLLETKPEDFSAKWFTGNTLDDSVQHIDKQILIAKNGQILKPINPLIMPDTQDYIRYLVKKIFERDSKIICDELIKKYQDG